MFRIGVGVLSLCGLLGGTAYAAPMSGLEVEFYPKAVAAPLSAASEDNLDDLFFEQDLVADEDLVESRGGIGVSDIQINNANAQGDVSDINAANSTTGDITGTALNNVTGTNVVMVNSGNGVVMNSITEINVILNNN